MRRLSKRILAFCFHKARGQLTPDSVLKAGYLKKTKNRLNACKIGSRLLKKVEVIDEIEKQKVEFYDCSMVTDEFVIAGIRDIAQNGRSEANRVRCWELLGKVKALFIEKQEITGQINYTQVEQDEYSRMTGRVLN